MSVAACPACTTGAVPTTAQAAAGRVPTHHLVLPTIHCAACIQSVESTLQALPDVESARVNLSRKRAMIVAKPGADPTPWITALSRAGFEAHEADDEGARNGDDYLIHLGVAGFAMMNVMLCSVAIWSGADGATRDFLHWVSAAIALPAAAFSAQPFFRSAWPALRAGRLNMDVPISLAILLACGMSLYEVVQGGEEAWFDAALSLTFFLLAGRVLDQRLRRAARSAADDLAALEPSRVICVEGEARISRPISEVAVGDTLYLTAGGRVPVDATLLAGPASVDRSALTGESDPVRRSAGDLLHAGEILLDGPHELKAVRVGEDTTLRRIAHMVSMAESARGQMRSLADRAAAIYTPAIHIISAGAFLAWFLATGDIRMALNVAVSTLIITCPCALGLAVPAVAVSATGALFREGFLVKSDTALERLATIDTVLFDKTGTLTQRTLSVPEGMPEEHRGVLRALAESSDHPLSRGLAKSLSGIPEERLTGISETAGVGIAARWHGTRVVLEREPGAGTVFRVGEVRYDLPSREDVLPGAEEAVAALRQKGYAVWMLTGDTPANAKRMAARLNIEHVKSDVRPDDKVAILEELQATGARVLMVGDGLNDTPALAYADASIAPGSALDASRSAADINIVSGDMSRIADALALARRARRRILENFGLAVCYNAVAVPVAVTGFATPLAAAIAMSTSSITVVLNAQRGTHL